MTRPPSSPFWPAILPGLALALGVARWLVQGSGNLYTDADKRFYVPDPDLGWRAIGDGPPWLGLELLAVIAAIGVAAAFGGWLIRRRERRTLERWSAARLCLWFVAAMPMAVPAWAFAGGGAPADSVEYLPAGLVEAPTGGVSGGLSKMPAGTYEAIDHDGSSITAHIFAGGDEFDARFAGGVGGTWRGNPADLTQPMTAEIHVDATSVDTGIALRTKQAREDLRVTTHDQLRFRLTAVEAARQDGPDAIAFSARGEVELVGEVTPIELAGVMRRADRARLGTSGPTFVINAEFELDIRNTPLRGDAGSYDDPIFHIIATLVLVGDAAGKEHQ